MDAAKFASTNPLDLSRYSPDFVAISFYKLFGYPSGLGALLVRKDAGAILKKSYFSGGTVAAAAADERFYAFKSDSLSSKLEDGTIPFLNIISLKYALGIVMRDGAGSKEVGEIRSIDDLELTMEKIKRHTSWLGQHMKQSLESIFHKNGKPVCRIYGPESGEVGSVVSFNLLRSNGEYVGYSEVEKLCSLNNIQIRVGFCCCF